MSDFFNDESKLYIDLFFPRSYFLVTSTKYNCVGVLVICLRVFTVFVLFLLFWYFFVYVYLVLFVLSVLV